MSTAHPLEALSAYLDDELRPLERSQVEAHLADCAACSERLAELAAVDALAREMPVAAPPGYFEALPARIRARVPARRRPAIPAWAMLVAASLLVAVIAPLVLEERRERAVAPASRSLPVQDAAAPPAAPAPTSTDAQPRPFSAAPPPDAAKPNPTEAPLAGRRAAEPPPVKDTARTESGLVAQRQQERYAAPPPQAAAGPPLAPPAPPQAPAAAPAPAVTAANAARPKAEAEQDKVQARDEPADLRQDAVAPPAEAGAAVGRMAEEKQTTGDRERAAGGTATTTAAARPGLLAKAADADTAARELSRRKVGSAEEARASREEWRRVAAALGDAKGGDDARVAVIEMGALAWRLGHGPADLALVRADAEAYLARADAHQADRVRTRMRSLDAARSPR